ncbi:hypothetical protein [Pseudomonas izuensis]|uniref:hypothetical protein n=1 Tax=Pseudomonas izuensis TaxID=2684212 RepID=UPI001357F263|nr:hypothetical protein [Pseudomonas izuensis]
MGDVMEHGFGFIETNRILAWLLGCLAAWLLGCLAAWLLGCLAAVGGKNYLPLRLKLMLM